MTEPLVFIEFAGRVLALTAGEFQQAVERGSHLLPAKPNEAIGVRPGEERLLTAEEASEVANVPRQWLLEAARKREVPHYQLGRYVRFRLSELAGKGRVPAKQHLELVTKG